jgi:SRSO17 transposase
MVQAIRQAGCLRSRWLTADEAFGRDTAFLDAVAEIGLWYFAEVPHDTRVWEERPATEVPTWSGRGRQPKRAQVVAGEAAAQTVAALAAALPTGHWRCYTINEGSQGPMVIECAALRVVTVRDALPGPAVWLVLRRPVGGGELKTFLSNAPVETSCATLARLSGMRWPIETCFEDGKQYLGLGDYEVRSWRGWHHHMTLCILAHHFLVKVQQRLKKKAPALTLPQAQLLLAVVLPRRDFNPRWALEVLGYRQQRNHAAYLSHRKRRQAALQTSMELSL